MLQLLPTSAGVGFHISIVCSRNCSWAHNKLHSLSITTSLYCLLLNTKLSRRMFVTWYLMGVRSTHAVSHRRLKSWSSQTCACSCRKVRNSTGRKFRPKRDVKDTKHKLKFCTRDRIPALTTTRLRSLKALYSSYRVSYGRAEILWFKLKVYFDVCCFSNIIAPAQSWLTQVVVKQNKGIT